MKEFFSYLKRRWREYKYPDRVILSGLTDKQKRKAFERFGTLANVEANDYGPPFEAPWVVFPHITSPFSIGWRMGGGEDFMCQFQAWYKTATFEKRSAFKEKWPEPETYKGFYDRLDGWHPVSENEI